MTMLSRYVSPSTALSGARWRRSSHSTAANTCVEAGALPSGRVAVRDSKDPSGPALLFPTQAWTTFVWSLAADTLRSR